MIDELLVAAVALTATAMISCLSVERRHHIRLMPQAGWILVILLIPLAGPIAWFIAGRPHATRSTPPHNQQPQAPDDDPAFLRSLGQPETGDNEDGSPPER